MSFYLAASKGFVLTMPGPWCLLCVQRVFPHGWWPVIKGGKSIKLGSLFRCVSLMPMLGLSTGKQGKAGAVLTPHFRWLQNALSVVCKKHYKMRRIYSKGIFYRLCVISILAG